MDRVIEVGGEAFHAKTFDALSVAELYEIMRARDDVFVGEERILYPDADGVDYDCVHVFCEDERGRVVAYARMYREKDEPSSLHMGRVLTRQRGRGLGRRLLDASFEAARLLGATQIVIDAQRHAEGFYRKCGFVTTSDVFMECGVEHVEMRTRLA